VDDFPLLLGREFSLYLSESGDLAIPLVRLRALLLVRVDGIMLFFEIGTCHGEEVVWAGRNREEVEGTEGEGEGESIFIQL
jgi:hypothetical protein